MWSQAHMRRLHSTLETINQLWLIHCKVVCDQKGRIIRPLRPFGGQILAKLWPKLATERTGLLCQTALLVAHYCKECQMQFLKDVRILNK